LLRASLSFWRPCFVPLAMIAALLLLPPSANDAEAAERSQARSRTAVQKQQSPAVARKATEQRAESRRAHPASRRQEGRRAAPQREARPARPAASPRREAARSTAAAPPAAEEMARKRALVEQALQRAERATGLSAEMLRRIAERESRLDPSASNPLSSARGLMQFTRDTWLEVVRDFGPDHGLGKHAEALQTDREGNIGARDWKTLQRILKLREDPHLAATLAAERLKREQPKLEETMGRPARPADLYLVHLLGPTGARRFLTALRETPKRSSLAVVGEAAKPNPGVFERAGRPLPVATVYEEVAEMFTPREAPASAPEDQPLLASATEN